MESLLWNRTRGGLAAELSLGAAWALGAASGGEDPLLGNHHLKRGTELGGGLKTLLTLLRHGPNDDLVEDRRRCRRHDRWPRNRRI